MEKSIMMKRMMERPAERANVASKAR